VYEWQQNPAYLRRPALVPGANLPHLIVWSKLAPDLPTYRYKQSQSLLVSADFFDIIRGFACISSSSW